MWNFLPSISQLLFVLFGAMALGCALAVVAQRNPLYSAISLVGVFVSLACLYLTLQAPFIAAIQVIVYAGAIMVLVVFVIMLLNVEEEVRRPLRASAAYSLSLTGCLRLSSVRRRARPTSGIRPATDLWHHRTGAVPLTAAGLLRALPRDNGSRAHRPGTEPSPRR